MAGLQVVEPGRPGVEAVAQRVRLAQDQERLPDLPVVVAVVLRGLDARRAVRQLEARAEEDLAPAVKIVDVAREGRVRAAEAPPRVVVRLLDDRLQDVAQRRDGVAVGLARARRQRPQRGVDARDAAAPGPRRLLLLRAVVGLGRAARVPARAPRRACLVGLLRPRRVEAPRRRRALRRLAAFRPLLLDARVARGPLESE